MYRSFGTFKPGVLQGRLSASGGMQKTIDIELVLRSTGEAAFVQVRLKPDQALSFLKTGSGGHTVRLGRDGDRLSESLAIASSTFHHRGDDNRGIRGSVNRIDAKEARRRQSGTRSALERRTHRSGSQPLVTMMETADLWKGDYFACFGGLDRPWHGRVLVQR